jgi:hypothetical protein
MKIFRAHRIPIDNLFVIRYKYWMERNHKEKIKDIERTVYSKTRGSNQSILHSLLSQSSDYWWVHILYSGINFTVNNPSHTNSIMVSNVLIQKGYLLFKSEQLYKIYSTIENINSLLISNCYHEMNYVNARQREARLSKEKENIEKYLNVQPDVSMCIYHLW